LQEENYYVSSYVDVIIVKIITKSRFDMASIAWLVFFGRNRKLMFSLTRDLPRQVDIFTKDS
jgi:hypothetical protein